MLNFGKIKSIGIILFSRLISILIKFCSRRNGLKDGALDLECRVCRLQPLTTSAMRWPTFRKKYSL